MSDTQLINAVAAALNAQDEQAKANKRRFISIHPKKKSAAYRAKKKAQGLKNRAIRAELNREWQGESRGKNPALYHSALRALSLGTAS